ncbi:hypothetical protein Tco_1429103 [Tanacetum coccineum]
MYRILNDSFRDSVISSSSTITYIFVYTYSEPGRVFWGADKELSDGGPEHPPSPDYVPGPEHPPSPVEVPYVPEAEYPDYLVPSDAEAPLEDQPLPADASPTTFSPGYVTDSDPDVDPKEDPEEDHADYPADGGDGDDEPSDDDDSDDDTDDEDEEPFKDEDDDDEEEKHLVLADSSTMPIVDPVPSDGDTEAFETDETAPTPAEVEILLALPIPPPSLLSPWSSLLPHIPSPPLPPPPSSLHLPPHVPISLPLPSSPLLSIPPPVDRREDTPEAKLPPHKRLCLTTPTSRNEVGESSISAPRPTRGHRADYGYISTMDAEIRQDTQDRQTQLFQRVDRLVEDRQFHYETARLLDQEALVSREAWASSVWLSSAIHYELQAYRTHTQMQDYRIASQESLMMTLIAHVSLLQGQLLAALGQIQALPARDQTHADDLEGAGSSA